MPTDTELSRRPLRVAMVHYRDAPDAGGSLRVGETIANNVDPKRVSAEMVFAYGNAGSVAQRAGVPCHFIGAKGPKDFPAWWRARTLFRRIQPDLIHFQDGIVWLRTALAGMRYKTVLHVHGRYRLASEEPKRKQPFRASSLLRSYLKHTEAQVCISNAARDSLLTLGWISPESSYVVYNSVDLSRFRVNGDRVQARARLGLPNDALLLGMVCRLVWEKGCADLLSTIERLPSRWHGVICGDGPLRQQLEQECKTRRIADRIHFLGLQDDVAPVYAALDAYAFLSRYEGFGLVLAEAMASGIPVFGIEGAGEYNETEYPLLSSDTADLVRFDGARNFEGDPPDRVLNDIARRISNYGAHPETYSGMTERARSWVTQCFAAPLQVEAMARVYEDICQVRRLSPNQLSDWYQSKRLDAVARLVATESPRRERVLV